MNRTRLAIALGATAALAAGCGAGSDGAGAGATAPAATPPVSETEALVALVAPSGDLAGTPWTIGPPFADQPDPTPNPTDCEAFDPIFALGDRSSASADFGGPEAEGAHTVRILDDLAAANATLDSVDRIVAMCPSVIIDGATTYEVSAFDTADGRGLVLANAGTQLVIVVQTAGRIVSTIELSGTEIPPDAVSALVDAVKQLLASVPD